MIISLQAIPSETGTGFLTFIVLMFPIPFREGFSGRTNTRIVLPFHFIIYMPEKMHIQSISKEIEEMFLEPTNCLCWVQYYHPLRITFNFNHG